VSQILLGTSPGLLDPAKYVVPNGITHFKAFQGLDGETRRDLLRKVSTGSISLKTGSLKVCYPPPNVLC